MWWYNSDIKKHLSDWSYLFATKQFCKISRFAVHFWASWQSDDFYLDVERDIYRISQMEEIARRNSSRLKWVRRNSVSRGEYLKLEDEVRETSDLPILLGWKLPAIKVEQVNRSGKIMSLVKTVSKGVFFKQCFILFNCPTQEFQPSQLAILTKRV